MIRLAFSFPPSSSSFSFSFFSSGTAGPQPRAPDLSGHCRTSTTSSRSQWARPDLNRELQISVGTAGPQLQSQWAVRVRQCPCQRECRNRCQIECLNRMSQIESQNECQNECQKRCQIECQKKCQNARESVRIDARKDDR